MAQMVNRHLDAMARRGVTDCRNSSYFAVFTNKNLNQGVRSSLSP